MPPRLRPTAMLLDLVGARVPALLRLPDESAGAAPVAAALLLHGYSSRKERMEESVGAALAARGIASLSIDLPLHGERANTLDQQALRNPLALAQQWRVATAECAAALEWMAREPRLDGDRLALVGYSMGAFLATEVAAGQPRVRAMVLAAGGDLPKQTPFAMLVRAVADPPRAIRRFAGRPLLMVHGRNDPTVRPDQAERLYAAAGEPKELRWYGAGHYLPPRVIDDACDWLAERLASGGAGRQQRGA